MHKQGGFQACIMLILLWNQQQKNSSAGPAHFFLLRNSHAPQTAPAAIRASSQNSKPSIDFSRKQNGQPLAQADAGR